MNEEKSGVGCRLNLSFVLTLLFYCLAVACIVSYLSYREEYPRLFIYLGLTAAGFRIVYYVFRFIVLRKK